MSLSSAAAITQSGLTSVTAEIATLSRNVSGSNDTTLYSRKIANVTSTVHGSELVSIARASNQAVFENLLTATAAGSTQDAIIAGLDTLAQAVGDLSSSATAESGAGGTSPAALIAQLAGALQYYSGSPSDAAAGAKVVSAAGDLASALNQASSTTQKARATADSDIAATVSDVNSLLDKFQSVDTQIVAGVAAGKDVTNLQDQRDFLLKQLSDDIGISTVSAPNGGTAIYTDSGATLFQGGVARTVAFTPTNAFSASVAGRAVCVNGAPITGSSAAMPISTGRIAGLATIRDQTAVAYQAQLDNIAAALIGTFREVSQSASSPDRPGLFTPGAATVMPPSPVGLASLIAINANVDPSQGGDVTLLRDGGISDPSNPDYRYNSAGGASFTGRLLELGSKLAAEQSFPAAGGLSSSASVGGYAAASIGWLEDKRTAASTTANYQDALLSTASATLSNSTGVNINDEMSKMIDLEQSFSASAKLLSVINDIFNSLLSRI